MVNSSTTERIFLNGENCNSIFRIPSHLVESYGVNLPSKATLRVDNSGKKWRVSIEKFKDSYFFTNGWKEFAEQVDLKSLDFLKFKPGSSSKHTGINKEKTRKRSGKVDGTTKDKSYRVKTKLSFTQKMKKHHRYRVDIPRGFVSGTGIGKGETIKLKDSAGREWPVIVRERKHIVSLGGGWTNFLIDNKVMIGSKISFTWLSGKIQVQVVKVGTCEQPLYATNNLREKYLQLRT